MNAAREQSRDSIGELYARHEAEVLAYFLNRTSDPETAADLAAETFAEVVLQWRRGVAVREPRGWLYSIAHGKLVDYIRRGCVARRARRRIGLDRLDWTDEELERVAAVASSVASDVIEEALRALPEDQRDAVLGRVVEEKDYSEIAAAANTTEAVVRQRVHRGLTRLRRLLKESS